MSKRVIKTILLAALVLFTLVCSVKLETLESYNSRMNHNFFNADETAKSLWEKELDKSIDKAPDLNTVISELENPASFQKYGKKLGISKTNYILVNGRGKIVDKSDELLIIQTNENESISIQIGHIFGNAVRDGSGIVDVNNFVNMTDFNNLSISLNKLVQKNVIDSMLKNISINSTLSFTGVMELREDQKIPSRLEIIPLKTQIVNGE